MPVVSIPLNDGLWQPNESFWKSLTYFNFYRFFISGLLFASSVLQPFSLAMLNPTIKMLALSFLLLIGFTLLLDGFGNHVPKGYIYFAMAFSVAVEMLNIRMRRKAKRPVRLHEPYTTDPEK